jgi:hypothetical protein
LPYLNDWHKSIIMNIMTHCHSEVKLKHFILELQGF